MRVVLILLLSVGTQLIFAQNVNLWKEVDSSMKLAESRWEGVTVNRKELNREALDVLLEDIRKNGSTTFVMPHPTKGEMTFDVKPAILLAKRLQEKYPDIQAYKGYNENGEHVRFDVNKKGLHAMAFTNEGTIYLDPESPESKNYMSYFWVDYKKNNPGEGTLFEEGMDQLEQTPIELKKKHKEHKERKTSSTHQVKKFSIAISTDKKYTNYHGGTVDDALEAIATVMNRVNGIFERDVASVFEIIDDNDKIIYTSSDVDPFAGKSLLDMLYINTDLLDSIIGEDNFDVGHVFSGTHQGGLAARGAVCHNKQRAQGGSTYPSPEGNFFWMF